MCFQMSQPSGQSAADALGLDSHFQTGLLMILRVKLLLSCREVQAGPEELQWWRNGAALCVDPPSSPAPLKVVSLFLCQLHSP